MVDMPEISIESKLYQCFSNSSLHWYYHTHHMDRLLIVMFVLHYIFCGVSVFWKQLFKKIEQKFITFSSWSQSKLFERNATIHE